MNFKVEQLKSFFSNGHERSLRAKKNVLSAFIIKGGSICINLVLVTITIDYVSPTQYGIWLTLSSLVAWLNFFDVGLGNGLKNKLAIAVAQGNEDLAKAYISTTYLVLGILSITMYAIYLAIHNFLDWGQILNTPQYLAEELSVVAVVLVSAFSIQFILQLINIVCDATQNSRFSALCLFLGNLLSLTIIFILTKTSSGSLLNLCLAVGLAPVVVQGLFSFYMYNNAFLKFKPSFKFAKLSYIKDILQVGFKFFIIQLGLILFYNTNNLIIAHVVGPEAVTPYSIAFKYFSIATMISGIIMIPFWAAFTDADARKDFDWIKKTISNLERIALALLLIVIVMLFLSTFIYKIWVGPKVVVPFSLSVCMAAFTGINIFRTIYCYYLNGVGKIDLQLYLISASGILNIPLAFYFGSLFGTTGVILATTILCLICGMIEIIQYKKLIGTRATGIWNR